MEEEGTFEGFIGFSQGSALGVSDMHAYSQPARLAFKDEWIQSDESRCYDHRTSERCLWSKMGRHYKLCQHHHSRCQSAMVSIHWSLPARSRLTTSAQDLSTRLACRNCCLGSICRRLSIKGPWPGALAAKRWFIYVKLPRRGHTTTDA